MNVLERPSFQFFPECADLLRALITVDEQLSELCSNFDEVVAAHQANARASGADASERADEYHALRIEIEAEILDRVRLYRAVGKS